MRYIRDMYMVSNMYKKRQKDNVEFSLNFS